jgi:hypothetical protein
VKAYKYFISYIFSNHEEHYGVIEKHNRKDVGGIGNVRISMNVI